MSALNPLDEVLSMARSEEWRFADEATADLASLRAQLAASEAAREKLTAALKPFADAYDLKYSDEYLHDDIAYYNKEFRLAAAALAAGTQEGE